MFFPTTAGRGAGFPGGWDRGGGIDEYTDHFSAYTAAFVDKENRVDDGGRVLLPPTCLAEIAKRKLVYPLQFEIRPHNGLCVYAGVLEFEAPGGQVIMPQWMFEYLKLTPGEPVRLRTVALPQGGLVKLRPHQRAFVEAISDPKSVLETHLKNHPVLTRGSTIRINYLKREFLIDVLETLDVGSKSVKAISTVFHDGRDTELKVEFARPLDMPPSPVEKPLVGNTSAPQRTSPPPQGVNVIGGQEGLTFKPLEFKPPSLLADSQNRPPASSASSATAPPAAPAQPAFHAFAGSGRTLSGKPAAPPAPGTGGKAAPAAATATPQAASSSTGFVAFHGAGRSLR